MLHVFTPDTRGFYKLEELWSGRPLDRGRRHRLTPSVLEPGLPLAGVVDEERRGSAGTAAYWVGVDFDVRGWT